MPKVGQRGIFLQPSTYGRSEAGQYASNIFDGTKEEVAAQAAVLDALGYLYEVQEGWGFSRLVIHYENNPTVVNEVPVDLWEYSSSKVQKDLLESDVFTGITATLSQKNIEIIRDALNGTYPPGKTTVAQTDFTDGNAANAFTIYKLMRAGYRDGIVRAPVLRHTQTVSRSYPITLSQLNVGRVFSTATLIAVENPPSWAVTGLPTITPAIFTSISLSYGWKKNDPAIQEIALRKVQLVQEWEFGLYAPATEGPLL